MGVVVVEGLVVRYGDVTAVDGLSFTAEPGQVTAVLGPNGAGKTSTIEVLEGLRRRTGGGVSIAGIDPGEDRAALAPRIGVMLQDGGVHPGVRPLEALRHTAGLYPAPRDPAAVLELIGLSGRERRTWRQLSGGERRRLALGLALVANPEIAFLDEPTAGVDPQGRVAIRHAIDDLRQRGATVVLTTHDLAEAERHTDHVVIIDRGRLVAAGPPAELVRRGTGAELRFGAAPGLRLTGAGGLSEHLGADVSETSPGEYLVGAAPTPATVAALTAWLAERDLPLDDLRAGRQRLEDVFLRLTTSPGGGGPAGDHGDGAPAAARRRRRRRGARR